MRFRPPRLRPRLTAAAGVLLLLTLLAAVVARQSPDGAGIFGQTVGEVTTTTGPEPVATLEPVAPVPAPAPPAPVPVPAAAPLPAPPPAVAGLVAPTTREAFLARVRAEALRQVTPSGLPAHGVVGDGFARPGMPIGPLPTLAPAAAPAPMGGPTCGGTTGGGSAAMPTSGTNVQEAGVDEPDLAKTDGRILLFLRGTTLEVVDVAGAPRPVASITLPGAAGASSLLLAGNRVMVFSAVGGAGAQPWPETDVLLVDLADPSRPRLVTSHRLAGRLVAARLLNGTARVVLAHLPRIRWAQPVDGSRRAQDAALRANRARIESSTFEQWVAPGTGCQDAYTSPVESGLATVAVRTIDPSAATAGPGVCVASQASTVYASPGALYVGTTTFDVAQAQAEGRAASAERRTALHRFDITSPTAARYTGSGEVAGTVLNQFSLSEHGGDLRVATTLGVGPGSESQVAVLRPAGATLAQVGAVGGLGRAERIFAVRFVGDIGYVVTFSPMLCDPLFVVDLSDPTRPRLRGTLEVQGFSSYLHPTGPGRVLSIGRDAPGARPAGAFCGTTSPQLSLYDVSQPDRPRQLQRLILPAGSSEAEVDHHAFTYWAPNRLLVVPVQLHESGFTGALAVRVEDGGLAQVARISHPRPGPTATGAQVRRSFVVGSRLLTVSEAGLGSNDLASLADQGFTSLGRG